MGKINMASRPDFASPERRTAGRHSAARRSSCCIERYGTRESTSNEFTGNVPKT
jgi:hypothetical protein